ncbi:MAG: bifunctional hydroxymethylpyrimidine kinase/phosphomethylpyrimidine kinase [Firmicutes bacterium]|nr:bifunctional hydroxymethylpyrimidine kinase/phosphomethylpyrimidine kinase [Bacillota bacterium]
MKRALTIAGSDSGGGAGIQADLKTFAAFSVFGMSAITAVTAQNTLGVSAIAAIDPEIVRRQIVDVVTDIGVDVIKIGMLFNADIIAAVAEQLQKLPGIPVVLDPVMRSKGGVRLLQPDAEEVLRTRLLPLCTIVTPNLPEAEALVGHEVDTREAMQQAAQEIADQGAQCVLVKGGHLEDAHSPDLLWMPTEHFWLEAERLQTDQTHGTGCTLSSAIAAGLAREDNLPDAVKKAKNYVTEAIRHAPGLGHGHGPLQHQWRENS